MQTKRCISIIGLGYVGLALAYCFYKKSIGKIICYDLDAMRIQELKKGFDRNAIFKKNELLDDQIFFTDNAADLKRADFHIISVPTPITSAQTPDLSFLEKATKILAENLKPNDIVIYESTVYPGVTEDICIPLLEEHSGLTSNRDFFVGYSPERINVGDEKHSMINTVKIISAQNNPTLEVMKKIYGAIVVAGLYTASSIKVAEAAKLLENTQRDLNISLMNEFSMTLHKIGVNPRDVRKAAATKWNFVDVEPGLVGGHCIGVDPYYFTFLAQQAQLDEHLVRNARQINNGMFQFVVSELLKKLIVLDIKIKNARVAIMGFSFKENSTDIRNTHAYFLEKELKSYGINVCVYDPLVDKILVKKMYDVDIVDEMDIHHMNALIFTVKHKEFCQYTPKSLAQRLLSPGVVMDLRNIWEEEDFRNETIAYWYL